MIDTVKLISDFLEVARIAGLRLTEKDIEVKSNAAPHAAPSKLPEGKCAVYVYGTPERCLKVGKAGAKSHARFTSQHYKPNSAQSTLARSLLENKVELNVPEEIDETSIGEWIRQNTYRLNILLNVNAGVSALNLLEAFVQCRLNPRFEGFSSQRTQGASSV